MSVMKGCESIVRKYTVSNLPKVHCYIVKDVKLSGRLFSDAKEADVYIPGQVMVEETLFHDFGHMTDCVLRKMEWRIAKKDFGWEIYREKSLGGRGERPDTINKAEARAVAIEYMLMKMLPHESWELDEEDFLAASADKLRYILSYHYRDLSAIGCYDKNTEREAYLTAMIKRHPDLTLENIMPAFAKAVDIFNSTRDCPDMLKTVLYPH